jgi:hypothetical protein
VGDRGQEARRVSSRPGRRGSETRDHDDTLLCAAGLDRDVCDNVRLARFQSKLHIWPIIGRSSKLTKVHCTALHCTYLATTVVWPRSISSLTNNSARAPAGESHTLQ